VAQRPADLTPLMSAQHFFGAELRHWRNVRGVSLASLGGIVHVTGGLIGKIEKAERWPHEDLVKRCDAALDTGGVLCRLHGLADHQRRRSPGSQLDHDGVSAPLTAPLVVVVLSRDTKRFSPEVLMESARAGSAWSVSGSPAGEGPDNVVDLAAVRGRSGVRVTEDGGQNQANR